MKKFPHLKIVACWVAALFLINDACWAAPQFPNLELALRGEIPSVSKIDVPAELATLDEVYESPLPNSRLVLQIQDAHANVEAQKNTKELLRYLNQKYGFKIIFSEGAAEELDPKYLRLTANKKSNFDLADALAQNGELSGEELYLLEHAGKMRALPIEEVDAYRKNYLALRKVFENEEGVDSYLSVLERKIDSAASKIFSPAMQSAIKEWLRFEKGNREFVPYLINLAALSQDHLQLDFDKVYSQLDWPQISRVLVLQKMESELDARGSPNEGSVSIRERAQEEKKRLVDALKSIAAPHQLIEAVERLDDRSIHLNRIALADGREVRGPRQLVEFLVEAKVPFESYPNLTKYAGYLILRSEIQPTVLLAEIDQLFNQLLNRMVEDLGANKEKGHQILAFYRKEALLRKLLHLELSRKEWKLVVEKKSNLKAAEMMRSLHQWMNENEAVQEIPDRLRREIEGLESAAYEFYEAAIAREDIFLQKMEDELNHSKKAVLVTGGFHTEGLKELFRKNEISYGILTPRISQIDSGENYHKIMLNPRLNFEASTLRNSPVMQSPETRAAMFGVSIDNLKGMDDSIRVGKLTYLAEESRLVYENSEYRLRLKEVREMVAQSAWGSDVFPPATRTLRKKGDDWMALGEDPDSDNILVKPNDIIAFDLSSSLDTAQNFPVLSAQPSQDLYGWQWMIQRSELRKNNLELWTSAMRETFGSSPWGKEQLKKWSEFTHNPQLAVELDEAGTIEEVIDAFGDFAHFQMRPTLRRWINLVLGAFVLFHFASGAARFALETKPVLTSATMVFLGVYGLFQLWIPRLRRLERDDLIQFKKTLETHQAQITNEFNIARRAVRSEARMTLADVQMDILSREEFAEILGDLPNADIDQSRTLWHYVMIPDHKSWLEGLVIKNEKGNLSILPLSADEGHAIVKVSISDINYASQLGVHAAKVYSLTSLFPKEALSGVHRLLRDYLKSTEVPDPDEMNRLLAPPEEKREKPYQRGWQRSEVRRLLVSNFLMALFMAAAWIFPLKAEAQGFKSWTPGYELTQKTGDWKVFAGDYRGRDTQKMIYEGRSLPEIKVVWDTRDGHAPQFLSINANGSIRIHPVSVQEKNYVLGSSLYFMRYFDRDGKLHANGLITQINSIRKFAGKLVIEFEMSDRPVEDSGVVHWSSRKAFLKIYPPDENDGTIRMDVDIAVNLAPSFGLDSEKIPFGEALRPFIVKSNNSGPAPEMGGKEYYDADRFVIFGKTGEILRDQDLNGFYATIPSGFDYRFLTAKEGSADPDYLVKDAAGFALVNSAVSPAHAAQGVYPPTVTVISREDSYDVTGIETPGTKDDDNLDAFGQPVSLRNAPSRLLPFDIKGTVFFTPPGELTPEIIKGYLKQARGGRSEARTIEIKHAEEILASREWKDSAEKYEEVAQVLLNEIAQKGALADEAFQSLESLAMRSRLAYFAYIAVFKALGQINKAGLEDYAEEALVVLARAMFTHRKNQAVRDWVRREVLAIPGYRDQLAQAVQSTPALKNQILIPRQDAARSEARPSQAAGEAVFAMQNYGNWLSQGEYDLSSNGALKSLDREAALDRIGAFLVLGNPDAKTFIQFAKRWHELMLLVDRQIPVVLAGGIGRGTIGLIDSIILHYKKLGRLMPAEEEVLRNARTKVSLYLKQVYEAEGKELPHPDVTEKNAILFILAKEIGTIQFKNGYQNKLRSLSDYRPENMTADEIYFERGSSKNTAQNFEFSIPVLTDLKANGQISQGLDVVVVTEPSLLARLDPTLKNSLRKVGASLEGWARGRIYNLDLNQILNSQNITPQAAAAFLDKVLYWAGPSVRMRELFFADGVFPSQGELKGYSDQHLEFLGLDKNDAKNQKYVPHYDEAVQMRDQVLQTVDALIEALLADGYQIQFNSAERAFKVSRSEFRGLDWSGFLAIAVKSIIIFSVARWSWMRRARIMRVVRFWRGTMSEETVFYGRDQDIKQLLSQAEKSLGVDQRGGGWMRSPDYDMIKKAIREHRDILDRFSDNREIDWDHPELLVPSWNLHLILWEILKNAKDSYSRKDVDGEVHLEILWQDGKLVFEISDDGVGFARIVDAAGKFDPEANPSPIDTTGKLLGGRHLGLFLARTIVKAYEGELKILSPGLNGHSSTVRVTLPDDAITGIRFRSEIRKTEILIEDIRALQDRNILKPGEEIGVTAELTAHEFLEIRNQVSRTERKDSVQSPISHVIAYGTKDADQWLRDAVRDFDGLQSLYVHLEQFDLSNQEARHALIERLQTVSTEVGVEIGEIIFPDQNGETYLAKILPPNLFQMSVRRLRPAASFQSMPEPKLQELPPSESKSVQTPSRSEVREIGLRTKAFKTDRADAVAREAVLEMVRSIEGGDGRVLIQWENGQGIKKGFANFMVRRNVITDQSVEQIVGSISAYLNRQVPLSPNERFFVRVVPFGGAALIFSRKEIPTASKSAAAPTPRAAQTTQTITRRPGAYAKLPDFAKRASDLRRSEMREGEEEKTGAAAVGNARFSDVVKINWKKLSPEEIAVIVAQGFAALELSRAQKMAILIKLFADIKPDKSIHVAEILKQQFPALVKMFSRSGRVYEILSAEQVEGGLDVATLEAMKMIWMLNPEQEFHFLVQGISVNQAALEKNRADILSWFKANQLKFNNQFSVSLISQNVQSYFTGQRLNAHDVITGSNAYLGQLALMRGRKVESAYSWSRDNRHLALMILTMLSSGSSGLLLAQLGDAQSLKLDDKALQNISASQRINELYQQMLSVVQSA